jgi:ribonuclease HI
MDHVLLFSDGACRGNPGMGAIAAAVFNEGGTEIAWDGSVIGETTNNRAEYRALILGLELSARYTRGGVSCYSDSELLVKQLNREYRVRDKRLRTLFIQVHAFAEVFERVSFKHVRRDDPGITRVDSLANDLLDAEVAG